MSEMVTTSWAGAMTFESEIGEHKIILDASTEFGGTNKGPRPKTLLLSALAGCTGMDVIAILNKMRIKPDGFRIEASGIASEVHPKIFTKIHLKYIFQGTNLPFEKLENAVNLSRERYCAVNAMLGKAADITAEIVVED